jgi:hypothetical protein
MRSMRELGRLLRSSHRLSRSSKGSTTNRLAPGWRANAVTEVDDTRAEGAGLHEFEIHPARTLGKEPKTTANQHRLDPGPILVDETQRSRLGGECGAADRDVAVPRIASQPLDLLRQAARDQAGTTLHR